MSLVLAGHELPGAPWCLQQEQAQLDTWFQWDTNLQCTLADHWSFSVPLAQRKQSRKEYQPCHPHCKYFVGCWWDRSEEHEMAFIIHLFLDGEWPYTALPQAVQEGSRAWAHSHRRQQQRVWRKMTLLPVSFTTSVLPENHRTVWAGKDHHSSSNPTTLDIFNYSRLPGSLLKPNTIK